MKLEYVLLGLIRIHPKVTGYDLKKIINNSTGYFFHPHLSQIYPALKKLEAAGCLCHETKPAKNKRGQVMYSITESGIEMLDSWLMEPFPFSHIPSCFEDYTLKYLFVCALGKKALAHYLDDGIAFFTKHVSWLKDRDLTEEREYIESLAQPERDVYLDAWELEYDFIVRKAEMQLEWLHEARKACD